MKKSNDMMMRDCFIEGLKYAKRRLYFNRAIEIKQNITKDPQKQITDLQKLKNTIPEEHNNNMTTKYHYEIIVQEELRALCIKSTESNIPRIKCV